jgi:hypothetical protein
MPVVSSFAGDSLLHQSGGFEPLRASNFSVVFYGVGDSDLLVLSLRDTSVPAIKIAKKGLKYFNETMNYAGSVTQFESQTLTYIDYVDRNVLSVLDSWRKLVWCEETGSIGRAAAYKKQGDIYVLPPGMGGGGCPGAVNATDGVRKWHLEGCWPESFGYETFNHDSEDLVKIKLSLSIDRAYPL